ncbi:MAG: magnesium and cobalt transport protein CorA [Actinomycetales bacterium]|nr:magnesium and cobalt transport protein CorA [Actinomycetales bacterium]
MIVDHAIYRAGVRDVNVGTFEALSVASHDSTAFAWVGLAEPSDIELNRVLGSFPLHETARADAVNARQRARIEINDNVVTFVMRTVFYDDSISSVTTGELICFMNDDFIITVRHGDGSPLVPVRSSLESKPNFLKLGPYAVLYGVLNCVINEYSKIAVELERDVINIETLVFSDSQTSHSKTIYLLKREVIEYRHAIGPLVSALQKLVGEFKNIYPVELVAFFQDKLDEVSRACDHAIGMDALLTAALQADLAQVQVQQNVEVRRISAWVALAAFPTMIAGLYGMNFKFMPELQWRYGYFIVVGTITIICGVLFYKFKRAKWL